MFKFFALTKFKICLFLLIVSIYLFFANGIPWVEADYQLKVAENLILNHRFSTEKMVNLGDTQARNNRFYDSHSITNVFLMLPIAAFGAFLDKFTTKDVGQLVSFLGALTGVIINALACLVFFLILLVFKRPLRVCFYATLCLAFATIIFPYASKNYEGNLNTLSILSSLYFLFLFMERKRIIHLIYCASFTGLAINTREFSWLFFLVLVVFVLLYSRKEEKLGVMIIFLITLTPFLILWGYYNWLRTGLFLTPIMQGAFSGRWAEKFSPNQNILLGIKNLLFSMGGSIFAYSPILIFSVFGWKRFFLERKKESMLILSLVVIFLLANAAIPEWFGLWGWGPRYTLEIAPLMMLPMGYWFSSESLKNRRKKGAFIAICAYSLIIQLSGTLTNWNARLTYLLSRKGKEAFLFTVQYSQWWDSLKTLLINSWNLLFGGILYLENPGYQNMSDISLQMSKSIFTWWNRLLLMGINPIFIWGYLILNLSLIFYFLIYIKNFLSNADSNEYQAGNS